MGVAMRVRRVLVALCGLLIFAGAIGGLSTGQDSIDRNRVKELYEKSKRGDKLTPDEQNYLDRALQELKTKGDRSGVAGGKWEKTIYAGPVKQLLEERKEQKTVGYMPLTEMSADDRHFGEDGGL